MNYQPPYGREEVPPEVPPQGPPQGPPEGHLPDQSPPPEGYTSSYGRPTTDDLIKSSYPKGRGGLERFLKGDKLVMIVALGVLLMFLGAIIMTIVGTALSPDQSDYDVDEYDDYIKDLKNHKGLRSSGLMFGGILIEFGILFLVFALLGGGMLNKELDNFTRLGMLIAGGLIIAFELLFLTTLLQLGLLSSL